MPSKDGWSLDREHDKITLGKKTYRNMEEWSRPCSVCGERFSIHTRTNSGTVNSAFGLKTCTKHRGHKLLAGDPGELERLRIENATMREELAPVYARNRELFEEVQTLKARLATYELQGAIENVAGKMPWE